MNIFELKKIFPTKRSPSSALQVTMVAATLLLGGCTTDGTNFSNFDLSKTDWFNQSKGGPKKTVTLARDPEVLADDNNIEAAIHNAVELARQKRFVEARYILTEIRERQDPNKDGYQAVSCAMALLALREGNIRTFKRIARQLDAALGGPINVAPSYVEVISLYRVLTDQALPVNAPDGIKRLKDQHFPLEKAKL
jgi:hypothetical protein